MGAGLSTCLAKVHEPLSQVKVLNFQTAVYTATDGSGGGDGKRGGGRWEKEWEGEGRRRRRSNKKSERRTKKPKKNKRRRTTSIYTNSRSTANAAVRCY